MHLKTENGNPLLVEFLGKHIARTGPLCFAEFMAHALYHPEYGYYTQDSKIGREGDFFTSVSVGSLYGELLSCYFAEAWRELGTPEPFLIVEQGAHQAQLACDILQSLREHSPLCYDACLYNIVEPSSHLEHQQQQTLSKSGFEEKTRWVKRCSQLPAITGIFFSNELIDSFPTHQIVFEKNTWQESFVAWNPQEEKFFFLNQSIQNPVLIHAIRRLPLPQVEGYTTEICLQARLWMQEVAQKMIHGQVITIDYGLPAEELYATERHQGTLRSYRSHQVSHNLLAHVGKQDITSHVDFSALMEVGQTHGLETITWTDQHRFLMKIAQDCFTSRPTAWEPKKIRALQTLTHPQLLGTSFKCLVQKKECLLSPVAPK